MLVSVSYSAARGAEANLGRTLRVGAVAERR